MSSTYLEAPGDLIDLAELRVAKARELTRALLLGQLAFVTLAELRREPEGVEVVVIDVEVERGQHVEHPIDYTEHIAVRFFPDDLRIPDVLALRADFPAVPHLNLRMQEFPRSLCLFDEPYDELRRSWSGARLVERIRNWLALTARGELHAADQPLEPLIQGSAEWLILPNELYDNPLSPDLSRLVVRGVRTSAGRTTYLAVTEGGKEERPGLSCVATVIVGGPQPHGQIRRQPATLQDLHTYLTDAGLDLIDTLRRRLRQWQQGGEIQALLNHRLILIVVLPKTRAAEGAIEASDIYAFLGLEVLGFIGEHLGVWALHQGQLGAVLHSAVRADQVKLALLNPTPAFSPARAALLAGRAEPTPTPITAIGAGALGSQVITHLLRTGYRPWDVIDDDILLPHNLGRHALDGWAVGYAKAEALAISARMTLNDPGAVTPIVADVLHPGERAEDVARSLGGAKIIVDMSASVAVARHLACDVTSPARRASLFLSPSGQDLVLLAEGTDRTIPLDLIEMQYYRLLTQEPGLREHLRAPGPGRRYARSCRDVSATIPQELVALHAAIGSRALRTMLDDPAPRLTIWRADPETLTATIIMRTPAPTIKVEVEGWTIYTDALLQAQLQTQREERLPNETGGVLIGSVDLQRRRIYVVLSIPSPPDSIEWPTTYIRGCVGLAQQVRDIDLITSGELVYVGEWHSHPQGHSTAPSSTDREALAQLTVLRSFDGLPALMAIVADRAWGWTVRQADEQ